MRPATILLFHVIAACLFSCYSQKIEWLADSCDLGIIREIDGPQSATVKFINVDDKPTFIAEVKPTCGCTSVSFTEDIIHPGDTAYISLIYNPAGRPGSFNKGVKVYIGDEPKLFNIKLVGSVIATPETLSLRFPYSMENLRLDKIKETAGKMKMGDRRHFFINTLNNSLDTLTLSAKTHKDYPEVELLPATLMPGENGVISIYYDSSKGAEYGYLEYKFDLFSKSTNQSVESETITLETIITPNPENLSEVYFDIDPVLIDLGEINSNNIIDFNFDITNTSKRELKIFSIFSLDKEIKINDYPSAISPESVLSVTGSLNPEKIKEGPFRFKIFILTNSVLTPEGVCNVVGEKIPLPINNN